MYENFYGLQGKPFALSPDPKFFYASKGHRRAMAYLEYGVQQQEGFIVITGEVGAGKTTLVRSLFETLGTKRVHAAQLVSTQLDAENLLRSVCLAFGLEGTGDDKASQLRHMERFLLNTRSRGQRALLVVDEAQNLGMDAVEELRMLSNFQGIDGPLLQSFLLGQPEFRDILRSENMQQLRQRVIATYHLGPMDKDDTQAYVEHRLRRVGWEATPHFATDIWPVIHEFTGGIPRKVNTLCDRLLLMGYLEERYDLDADAALRVMDEIEEDFGAQQEPAAPEPHGVLNGVIDTERAVANELTLIRLEDSYEAMEKRLDRIEHALAINYRQSQRILDALDSLDKFSGFDHNEVARH